MDETPEKHLLTCGEDKVDGLTGGPRMKTFFL
jgi:hypothetical protein